MKKISAVLLGLMLISGTTFADQVPKGHGHIIGMCGFTDTVNFTWPAGSQVLSIVANGGLATQQVSASSYNIYDNGSCSAGVVTVKVGTDAAHESTVQIADGPWQYLNATQTHSKGGYVFTGDEQTGSNSYAVGFTQK